jgi:hypothetical protein
VGSGRATGERQASKKFFQNMVDGGAAASQLRWPSRSEDIPHFADQAIKILKKTMSLSPDQKYSEKYMMRKYLLVLEEHLGPRMLDDIAVKSILKWVPDSGKHLAPIFNESGRFARERFGFSVPWIACWACLSPQDTPLLDKASAITLLRLASTTNIVADAEPGEENGPGLAWVLKRLEHSEAAKESQGGRGREEG